jgi:hypothetical protein
MSSSGFREPNTSTTGQLRTQRCGPTVQEIHIDFLLQEEFSVDPQFLRSFVGAAGEHWTPLAVEHVRHSVSDQYGEADLVVIFRDTAGLRVAMLIEDKIRAAFQVGQAERYLKRGEHGRISREWDSYLTVLVAPASYIKAGHGFQAAVSLEQIISYLSPAESKRQAFKAQAIADAIRKATETGVQVVDDTVTAFRTSYFAHFEEFFKHRRQDISMRAPAPTWKGDTWFEFRSPLLPKGAYINHKSDRGFVDLTFPNSDAGCLRSIESNLEIGMSVHQTYKSAAIRLLVPLISSWTSFDQERIKVTDALSAVTKLLDFYSGERLGLDPALNRARASAHS